MSSLFNFLFATVALIISFFYGFKAVRIFGYPDKNKELPNYVKSWFIHQFWFNLVGALTGWVCFYLFLLILQDVGVVKLSLAHYLIGLLGVLGIVGLIPSILAGISSFLPSLFEKLLKKLAS